jgi:type I restriction enzyme R subunit
VRIKEAINTNDESRKRFEILAREVFSKFKSCLIIKGVNDCRADNSALGLIYKGLQKDRDAADISGIMQQLHEVVDAAIVPRDGGTDVSGKLYDISAIDFERLRAEFERSPAKRTTVLNLIDAIEKRLARMMAENPTRTNFQARFEEMVTEYNEEKDRVTIEATFQALLRFVAALSAEESRAMREGLAPEALTLFDLLKKPDLQRAEIERLKGVAASLLATLDKRRQEIQDWRAKEATRDTIRQEIYDFLYNDETGLPDIYSPDEIMQKSEIVFAHVFSAATV